MGRIEAVCRSERKGDRKVPAERGRLVENHGLAGDAHAGPWHRQLSLLLAEAAAAAGCAPGDFGENLLLSGLDLDALGLGSRIRLGREAVVSITQIGKECHTRCVIHYRTGDCIMPRRGLFARVESGGEVAPGDEAEVLRRIPRETPQAVVITASDRGARGERVDTAGPAAAEMLRDGLGAHVYRTLVLPDDRARLSEALMHYADGHGIDLVVVAGGTGFAPRDVTPEAVREVVSRLTPGLDEAMRQASAALTKNAMLSRAASGIRGRTLILSLPGSERAVRECLGVVLPALPHGLAKLRGDPGDCAPRP
ncbi:MAG: molybdopterin-binding protein [Planctomycetes bacterium]|jgi:molybdenum cofactor synthesis domain-containing protein|nr:molybdopterin-binding protein [Planctomycetota bacterium]